MTTYKEIKKLDDKFNSEAIEKRCMNYWEENRVYAYDKTASRENTYVVDTPPPTVSGSLHIGHIMSYTQTDVQVRYQRMMGKSIFYPIGWDDNGLPTERRVQNFYGISCNAALPYDSDFKAEHNPNAKELKEVSRKNFVETCEILTETDEKAFEDIFRRIGHSYDWSLKYTTISPLAIKVSQESFLDLVKKGLAHSVESPTMWDIDFQSAVAQAEIEDRETAGFFHDIRFGVEGEPDTYFTIATTRPEFLPACIAVVAHPDDERYKKYFGKNAIVPLFDIPVPIVPSEHAEMDKGTGIMMVCTFGDAADVAWWKKSGLPIKQIIGLDGRIIKQEYGTGNFVSLNVEKAKKYYDAIAGLKVKQARAQLVEFLKETGDLLAEPKPLMHPVKFYEKGSQPLEFVSSRQWFIDILKLKQQLIEQGRKIKWYPSHMQTRYETWVDGLNQDWCISRQRFFGVPFPVWYKVDENGNTDFDSPIFPTSEQLPIDPMTDVPNGYTAEQRGVAGGFVGDKDIMDTWATSSVTPQIAMAFAPEGHNLSLPFDVRPQAHDIIRTWAFYTIMKAYANENMLPWKEAHISGFVLDPDRKKMSKSKGNVVTPMNLLEKYSSDAVRYWAARAKLGIDIAFEEQVMDQGKKLCMKIFNASRFVSNIVENSGVDINADYVKNITNPLDKAWIARMCDAIDVSRKAFENHDYSFALETTEHAFWDFCDNYLEIVKTRAYSDNPTSAVSSLMVTIDLFAKLFAPFLSFITEEVFQARAWGKETGSVHVQPFPSSEIYAGVKTDADLYRKVVSMVELGRKVKADEKRSLRTPVLTMTVSANQNMIEALKQAQTDIENVLNIKEHKIEFEAHSEDLEITNCVLGEDEPKKPKA
ncbi:MAG: valine--tRNA ligase [Alphaproteobacteria bacterium]|nr:valine--tRNA ligase [Alphaproteobacteria bacterium]